MRPGYASTLAMCLAPTAAGWTVLALTHSLTVTGIVMAATWFAIFGHRRASP